MVNCFLAREDDGFTLDVVGSAPGIREAAQRIGVPICRIVLTHAHIDHVGSLDALACEYPRIEFAVGDGSPDSCGRTFRSMQAKRGKSLSVSRA
jgi:glyoxylase-like metal-dependent hydrolase (beta-lactamase superfamily II)